MIHILSIFLITYLLLLHEFIILHKTNSFYLLQLPIDLRKAATRTKESLSYMMTYLSKIIRLVLFIHIVPTVFNLIKLLVL